ncbi:hypothetical protein [Neptunomonas sp.]|uniref:hypothetical protein n=1 Tax=Neptunomonas sp. TaxID=1971898 RepID=UPI0025FCD612|nr:hypothetical protein [Neptunomonas sp.]
MGQDWQQSERFMRVERSEPNREAIMNLSPEDFDRLYSLLYAGGFFVIFFLASIRGGQR